MCLSLAISAVRYGANVANYTQVMKLLKDENDKVCGAKVMDRMTGEISTF